MNMLNRSMKDSAAIWRRTMERGYNEVRVNTLDVYLMSIVYYNVDCQ